jgi:hypothetical protein
MIRRFMVSALKPTRFAIGHTRWCPMGEHNSHFHQQPTLRAGPISFFASGLRQPRRCNQRARGRIGAERNDRILVGRRVTPITTAIRAAWYYDLQST